MKIPSQSEVLIDPYTVDFLVSPPFTKKQCVIEMNGPSHYPFSNRTDIISAKDQLKIKILSKQGYPLLLIHHTEWSAIKGVTGKIDFLRAKLHQATRWRNEKYFVT